MMPPPPFQQLIAVAPLVLTSICTMGRWFKGKEKQKEKVSSGSDYVLAKGDITSAAAMPSSEVKNVTAKNFTTSFNSKNSSVHQSIQPSSQSSLNRINNDVDVEHQSECLSEPDLHWKHRVLGSCACAFLGSLISSNSFRQLAAYTTFNSQAASVVQATLGNVLVICSSCFWTGPKRQLQSMFGDLTRKLSCVTYCGSILTTLILAFIQPPLVSLYYFVLMIIQYVSVVVYALSYVPCCKNRFRDYVKRKFTRGGRTSSNMADANANEPVKEGVMA